MRPATKTLPPYSGERPCPKCGYNLVGTKYRASNFGTNYAHYGWAGTTLPAGKTIRDYDVPKWRGYPIDAALLERDCKRCEFAWVEAPLAPEEEGKQIARVAFEKQVTP